MAEQNKVTNGVRLTSEQKSEVETKLTAPLRMDYERLRGQGLEHELAMDRALAPVRARTRGTINVLR